MSTGRRDHTVRTHHKSNLQGMCVCWCDVYATENAPTLSNTGTYCLTHVSPRTKFIFASFYDALHSPYITEQAATQLQWYDPDAATPCTEWKEHSLTPGTELTSNFPLLITIQ